MVEAALVDTGLDTDFLYPNGMITTSVHQLHGRRDQASFRITGTSHMVSFIGQLVDRIVNYIEKSAVCQAGVVTAVGYKSMLKCSGAVSETRGKPRRLICD